MHKDVAIIIPARLASTRLPHKMLLPIGDRSLIEHTYRQALEAGVGEIYVATDSLEIAEVIKNIGGKYVMTREDCPKGSDRVYEALEAMPNKEEINYVINIQGDMPFLDPKVIRQVIENLKNSDFDIITPITKVGIDVASSVSNVKVVAGLDGRALYFSRSLIPHGASEWYYHIGIYGFKLDALRKFVHLPESYLEKAESLEQLRALENGMSIGICYADSIPISVDTPEDLEKAIDSFESRI